MNHPIFNKIDNADHIVLILHVSPDADSFGSASAFYSHILRVQKKVTLFCATPEPDRHLALLPWFDKIRNKFPSSADLAICFDCGSKERLGVDVACELVNIDHHISNEGFGDINIVNTAAISTTQVVYDLFKETGFNINVKMATALYAGLLDDSKCFLHAKTSESTFLMAAELLRCGADSKMVVKKLFHTNSLASLRLKGLLFEQLRLRCSGQVAILHVSIESLEKSGALPQNAESALEELQTLATVKISVMLRERHCGGIKCSLRGDGSVDLATIAKSFGGGGHRDSSGFVTPEGTLYALEEKLIMMLCEEID